MQNTDRKTYRNSDTAVYLFFSNISISPSQTYSREWKFFYNLIRLSTGCRNYIELRTATAQLPTNPNYF